MLKNLRRTTRTQYGNWIQTRRNSLINIVGVKEERRVFLVDFKDFEKFRFSNELPRGGGTRTCPHLITPFRTEIVISETPYY